MVREVRYLPYHPDLMPRQVVCWPRVPACSSVRYQPAYQAHSWDADRSARLAENPATRYPGNRLQTSCANRFAAPGPKKKIQGQAALLWHVGSRCRRGKCTSGNNQAMGFAILRATRYETRYARCEDTCKAGLTDDWTFFSRCNMCSVLCMPFVLTKVLLARREPCNVPVLPNQIQIQTRGTQEDMFENCSECVLPSPMGFICTGLDGCPGNCLKSHSFCSSNSRCQIIKT